MTQRKNGRYEKSKYKEIIWELIDRFLDNEYLCKNEIQKEYFPSKSELQLRRDKPNVDYVLLRVRIIMLEDYGSNFGAIEGGENPRHGLIANKKVPAYGVYFLNNKALRAKAYAANGIIAQKELEKKKILPSGKVKVNKLLSPSYTNGN